MVRLLLPIWIGFRYNRSSDKQQFLSLLSWVSLIGMMLGVSVLVVVLSVMNGFQAEIRDRMLDLIAHGQVEAKYGEPLNDWRVIQQILLKQPQITAALPLVGGDVMLSALNKLRAGELQGVDVSKEDEISHIEQRIVDGNFSSLESQRYGIVLGSIMARELDVMIGDTVSVLLPKMIVTPLGIRPRIKQFTVVAIFEVGGDMDATHAYINLADAQRLYQIGNKVHAVRYLTDNVLAADRVAIKLQPKFNELTQALAIIPWTEKRSQLFSAIKMEKIMIMFMLSMVIAVAAFNLISVLSMMVSAKRNEVAVLRMMGLGRSAILGVFLTQGLSLSLVSLIVGGTIGILVALNLTELIMVIENTFGFYIFDPKVFYVSGLPSDLQMMDILYVFVLSIVLSIACTIYPAYQASKIQPVEALQYQ